MKAVYNDVENSEITRLNYVFMKSSWTFSYELHLAHRHFMDFLASIHFSCGFTHGFHNVLNIDPLRVLSPAAILIDHEFVCV